MTRTDEQTAPPRSDRQTAGPRDPRRRWAAALVAVPDRLVMVLFWTSLVVAAAVLGGAFRPVVVLPVLAAVLAATWRLRPAPIPATRASVLSSAGAVVFAAAWAVLNAPYASRYVVVDRDPGFLTLQGIWLTTHANPDIPAGVAVDAAAQVAQAVANTGRAYELGGDLLYVQGADLVPGLMALAGWAGGTRLLLVANLAVGAVGLLAVHGLARRLLPPVWALVPVVALGLSLPMMVFSRAVYTEPTALVLVVGGVTMSLSAYQTRSWWRHLLAGALVGGSALARIDGAASVIGLVAGVGIAAAVAVAPRARMRNLLALALTAVGGFAAIVLGWIDLQIHSPGYFTDHWPQLRMLVLALATVTVLCLVVALARPLAGLRWALLRHRRGIANAAVAATAVGAVFLASRPLWLVNRLLQPGSTMAALVGRIQEQYGVEVDPTRSYDEMTVQWLALYLGWPAVAAAVAGIALLAWHTVKGRDPRSLVVLGVVVAPSLLYLWSANITPDQIWAMRRFLPATLPGFLVVATVALHALWRARPGWPRWVAGAVAVVVALFPLTTWSPLLTTIEQDGRLGEAEAVCDAVAGRPVVYVSSGGPPAYLATIRSMCDVATVHLLPPPTQEDLATVRDLLGGDVALVTFGSDEVRWAGGEVPEPLLSTDTSQWAPELNRLPRTAATGVSTVWVGRIEADGTVTALPPAGAAPADG